MTLTFIVPARHDPSQLTATCLRSAVDSARAIDLTPRFVLIADHSDAQAEILALFARFRDENPGAPIRIVRAREWLHYAGAFALGLSLVEDGDAFFLSNDMIMTEHYLRAVTTVAGNLPNAGVVRGTANIVDGLPEHAIAPHAGLGSRQSVEAFAKLMFDLHKFGHVADDILSGDAVLIRRALLDKIGVLDTQFFGYWGDVDYGLRAQLAGLDLVCAKGAWLYHLGAGHLKHDMAKQAQDAEKLQSERDTLVREGYERFRRKWGDGLPDEFTGEDGWADLRDAVAALAQRPTNNALRFTLPASFWDGVEVV